MPPRFFLVTIDDQEEFATPLAAFHLLICAFHLNDVGEPYIIYNETGRVRRPAWLRDDWRRCRMLDAMARHALI